MTAPWGDEPAPAARRSGAPVRRGRRLVRALVMLATTVIGLVAGSVAAAGIEQEYESTVRLLVGPIGAPRETLDAAALLTSTYADLITSRAVVVRVAEDLGVQVDPDDMTAIADERSRVILLSVRDGDPDVPARVAERLAAELIATVEDSAVAPPPGAEVVPAAPGQVRVLDGATEPQQVTQPTLLFVLLGGALGFLVGVALLRLAPALRATVDEDFVGSLGIPTIVVRRIDDPDAADDEWELVAAQVRHEVESVRPARSVAFVPLEDDPDVVTFLLHLVAAEAATHRPVTLADADPRRPTLERCLPDLDSYEDDDPEAELGVPVVPSLVGSGRATFHSSSIRVVVREPERDPGGHALGRLQSIHDRVAHHRMLAVLAPAMGSSPVAVSAGLVTEAVVLVVRAGRSRKNDLGGALEALDSVGVQPVAVVELTDGFAAEEIELRPGWSASEYPRRAQYRTESPRPQAHGGDEKLRTSTPAPP